MEDSEIRELVLELLERNEQGDMSAADVVQALYERLES